MHEPTDDRAVDHGMVDRDVYETEIGDRAPSEAVLDVVGAIRDVTPPDLPPLYDAVDPEALDDFCASADEDARPTISFDYDGFVVTVHGTDTVAVTEP